MPANPFVSLQESDAKTCVGRRAVRRFMETPSLEYPRNSLWRARSSLMSCGTRTNEFSLRLLPPCLVSNSCIRFKKCRRCGMVEPQWLSRPLTVWNSFHWHCLPLMMVSMSLIHSSYLSWGSFTKRRLVSRIHPRTVWSSAGVPSARSLMMDKNSFRSIGSLSDTGRPRRLRTSGMTAGTLSMLRRLSKNVAIKASTKTSTLPLSFGCGSTAMGADGAKGTSSGSRLGFPM